MLDNPKSVTYLSPEIQNEFISILANSVRNRLVQDIIQSKYYGLLVDALNASLSILNRARLLKRSCPIDERK